MYSQLIKEDDLINNLTKIYTYDNYGNILSKKIYTYNTSNLIKEDKYQYNNSNWQDLLTKFNNDSITYDGIGNPLSIGSKTLSWMNGRELATYSDGANSISYKYNLNGIRTSKVVNGIKTEYILEGNKIIFENRNNDVIYYIYNTDEVLGFVYKNKTYYYHKNMFGDIIGILDSNYNEIVRYEYDSWGALINITDNSNINLGTINPFRYRLYYYDTETNLYYLNSRYYNPEWGRFVNADAIISSNEDYISNNLFTYVSNNPINFSDSGGFSFIGILKNKFNKVKRIIRKAINKLESVRKSNSNSSKSVMKSSKSPSISRPSSGEPFGVSDIPNGDVRIFGPKGDLANAKDFDESHPWRHPDLKIPHVHDWDEFGVRQDPRNPSPEEEEWWNDHKKELGKAVAVGGVTIGAGYLIYRGVRMLPSLTPWTFWTIPYNLVTP